MVAPTITNEGVGTIPSPLTTAALFRLAADHRDFYWSWAERIAPITDPHAAARKISAVLRAVPEPTHG